METPKQEPLFRDVVEGPSARATFTLYGEHENLYRVFMVLDKCGEPNVVTYVSDSPRNAAILYRKVVETVRKHVPKEKSK